MLSVMSKNKETWKTDMIKTLRITSIIAVVLAVVFFVLPAVFGVRGDEQNEQFLNSAGVIEEFKKAKGDKVKGSRHEISPLVKQAEAFALYLNPPPKPRPSTKPSEPRSEPRPKTVSAKFKLVGTSRYALHPELSLALIDEPGKGLRWIRQLGKVGHLIIEQVKDGLVIVRDGESTFELVAERPGKRSLIKEKPEKRSPPKESSLSGGHIVRRKLPKAETDAEAQMSAEEKAAREKALAELDAMLIEMGLKEAPADVEVNETDSGSKAEAIAGVRERLIPEPEAMHISAEEARRLGRLGRRLKDAQREPNRVEDDRTESDANKTLPDLSNLDLNNVNSSR